jgi:PAS domain S-box-containing protein
MGKFNKIAVKNGEGKVIEELMYHDFFELNPQPMWVYDLETYGILFVNEAALRHYGYSKKEFLGLTIKDLRPAADVQLMLAAVEFVRKHDQLFSRNIYRHQKKDGEIIIVQIQGNIILLNGRKAELILATDITQMVEAQRETITANEKLLDAQNIAGLGYWSRDMETKITEWSPHVYQIYGRQPETFSPTPENLRTCLYPEDWHLLDQPAFSMGKPEFEHRILTADNQTRWVFERLRFVRDDNGKLISVQGIVQDITEKRKADEKFKAVFEHTSDAILIGDDLGNCIDFNAAAVEMFGYHGNEFKTMHLDQVLKAEAAQTTALWNELLKDQCTNRRIAGLQRKDGTMLFGSIFAKPSILPGYNLCVISDVTRKVQEKNRLIASERRFEALVQEGADLIAILDLEGNYSFVSENFFPILGIRPQNFMGKNAFDFVHPDDKEEVISLFSGLSHLHKVKIEAFRFADAEGQWRWITTTATNLIDDDAVNGIVTSSRDITESVMITQALKLSNDRFRMILKAANEAIFDWDIIKDKVEWGTGFQDVYGYDLRVYNNHLWTENIYADDKKRVLEELKTGMNDRDTEMLSAECRYNKADGTTVLVEYRIIFMRNPEGAPIRAVGSLRDITDHKQSLLTIQLQNEKLREIAWAQSHVVRAPLARMMSLINLIKNYPNSEEERNEILDCFLSSAAEFDQIVREISSKTRV